MSTIDLEEFFLKNVKDKKYYHMRDFHFKSFGVRAKAILMNCTPLYCICSGGLWQFGELHDLLSLKGPTSGR
jgi:hypothetical protein